jgi:hypothetical protein
MTKCSKSHNGKHVWKNSVEENRITGEERQYRTCIKCNEKQVHVKDLLDNSGGWQSI